MLINSGKPKIMFLQILCLLPLLFKGVSSDRVEKTFGNCQGIFRDSQATRGTAIKQLDRRTSLDDCVTQCDDYNRNLKPGSQPCEIVTFFKSSGQCFMYAMDKSQAEDQLFDSHNGADSAIIKTCNGNPPPSLSIGCGIQDDLYKPNMQGNIRVVKGRETAIHSWPWQLLFKTNNGHFCGASLLRVRDNKEESDIAVTAGHCIDTSSTQWVIAGKHQSRAREDGEQEQRVVDARVHEQYGTTINDIALVRLEQPIKFSKIIRPVCLPSRNEQPPINQRCFATGWGKTANVNMADVLQQATMYISEDNFCSRKKGPVYESRYHVCAGDGVTVICDGDSGGPLVCQGSDNRWIQYGITSFGPDTNDCTRNYEPSVFTRVSQYVEWINKTMAGLTRM